jgi:large subunit ribosomal protein L9
MEGLTIQISQKAGVDGRLFGSVTNHDIAEAIVAQGFELDRGAVRMPDGPIKLVGDHSLVVALHHDVTANITVSVLGEH